MSTTRCLSMWRAAKHRWISNHHYETCLPSWATGCWKTDCRARIANLTGFPLFHNHLTVDLVSSLFPFGSESFVRLREEIWLAAFAEAARQKVSFIFTFNPERTVRERFIPDAIEIVESAGGKIIFVELHCAEEELERRLEDVSRKEFGKLASIAQYRSLRESGAFQFPELPSALSLDTTNHSAAESARLIGKYLVRPK